MKNKLTQEWKAGKQQHMQRILQFKTVLNISAIASAWQN